MKKEILSRSCSSSVLFGNEYLISRSSSESSSSFEEMVSSSRRLLLNFSHSGINRCCILIGSGLLGTRSEEIEKKRQECTKATASCLQRIRALEGTKEGEKGRSKCTKVAAHPSVSGEQIEALENGENQRLGSDGRGTTQRVPR